MARTIITFGSIWAFGIVLAFQAIRAVQVRDAIARWRRIHFDVKMLLFVSVIAVAGRAASNRCGFAILSGGLFALDAAIRIYQCAPGNSTRLPRASTVGEGM